MGSRSMRRNGLEQIFCSISGGANGGSAEFEGDVIVYLYVTQALGVDIVVR